MRRYVVVCLACWATVVGCAPPPVLEVHADVTPKQVPLTADRVAAMVKAQGASSAPGFAPLDARKPWAVALWVTQDAREGERVQVALGHVGEVPLQVEVDNQGGDLEAASLRAVRRAIGLAQAEQALRVQGEPGARALLAQDDAHVVILALEWIARQRRQTFAPAVRDALASPDVGVRKAALKALATVGRGQDVPAVAERALAGDIGEAVVACETLAAIGGAQAEAVLAFMLRHEEDPDRRVVVESALRHLVHEPSAREQAGRRGHR